MIGEAHQPSVRAQIITRRTYARPLDEAGTRFERWDETIDRVVGHQRWLWERAQEGPLTFAQADELEDLRDIMLARKALLAGRTLWLGGTELSKRRESSSFNCAGSKISSVHDLVDITWLLLQGAGVGFKPVNGTLSGFSRQMDVEVIRSERTARGGREENVETFDKDTGVWTISVGDSAEAWAKSSGKLVVGRYPAKKLVIDLSSIRPPGTRLRGYGWICSGDEKLAKAYAAIAAIRNRAAGKFLGKIDLLDITNWLGTILSSRRSAQAALMDHGDPELEAFATAKAPGFWEKNPQRAQSNNGIMFWEKPAVKEIKRLFDLMVDHGGAEPSFNNAEAARRRAPWFETYNPCVTADTWILTDLGPRKVADLIGLPFVAFVDGQPHHSTDRGFFPTGEKAVYRVETDRGYSFECTDNHQILKVKTLTQHKRETEWVELGDLGIGDRISLHNQRNADWEGPGSFDEGWLVGSLIGDGVFCSGHTVPGRSDYAKLSFWGDSKDEMRGLAAGMLSRSVKVRSNCGRPNGGVLVAEKHDRLNINSAGLATLAESFGVSVTKRLGPEVERTSPDFHAGFLRGWFDADGTVGGTQNKGVSVRLTSVSDPGLRVAQRMLARLGIISTIYHNRQPEGFRSLPDGNGGVKDYYCQEIHELVITGDNLPVFAERVGFHEPAKREKLSGLLGQYKRAINRERFSAKIRSITPIGVRPVFDCTIPTAGQFDGNGVNLHNCFEILLANRGFCNLCNTNVARFRNDERGLHRTIWLMARANYRQTLVNLRDGILQSAWHENNESLRLCGVSLTGLTQRPDIGHYQLKQIRNTATAGAYSMADELGLERPKNISSVQPAGTLGKIMDATEGAHKPLGRYIFNNVGFSRHDPLVERLTDAGYEVTTHPTESDGVLIKIPISWPTVPFQTSSQGVPVNTESAISQLERYRMLQESFVDQNTSITVSYDPSEVKDMVKWFDKNWDSYVGVSFLFRNDPTKTAKDLSFAYLPQEVTTKENFDKYVKGLKPIDLESTEGIVSEIEDDCATGACPVR